MSPWNWNSACTNEGQLFKKISTSMDKPYKDRYGQYRQIRWKQLVTPTKQSSGMAACSTSTLRRVFQVVGEQPADPVSRNFSILVPKEESSSSRKRNKNVSLRLIGLKHRKMKKFRRLLSQREPRASKFSGAFDWRCFYLSRARISFSFRFIWDDLLYVSVGLLKKRVIKL